MFKLTTMLCYSFFRIKKRQNIWQLRKSRLSFGICGYKKKEKYLNCFTLYFWRLMGYVNNALSISSLCLRSILDHQQSNCHLYIYIYLKQLRTAYTWGFLFKRQELAVSNKLSLYNVGYQLELIFFKVLIDN